MPNESTYRPAIDQLNVLRRFKNTVDQTLAANIDAELARIAPDLVCNGYGTNIIDKKQRRVMIYVAHQRLINRWSASIQLITLIAALSALVVAVIK